MTEKPLPTPLDRKPRPEVCDCDELMLAHDPHETHYYRECQRCGARWWSLHCPHDGHQSRCECGERLRNTP